jgi:hypothetical protein
MGVLVVMKWNTVWQVTDFDLDKDAGEWIALLPPYQAVFFSLHAIHTDVHGTALRRTRPISSSQIEQTP